MADIGDIQHVAPPEGTVDPFTQAVMDALLKIAQVR